MTLRPSPSDRRGCDRLPFGVVNLDKPPGPSAHEVTAWVRDLAGVDRAAHAGTLDPKVTGCLPILLGDATRLAQVFLEGAKEYVAVLELHRPAPHDLEAVIDSFETQLYQKPPRKSAVRRRLRTREIYDLEILDQTERQVLLRIACESGTYIRKLCHDIGLALGTGAHMGDLRRIGTDPFDDSDLVTLHDFADALAFAEEGDPEPLEDAVQPAERSLVHLPRVTIPESAAREVAEGAPVYGPGVLSVEPPERPVRYGGDDDADDADDTGEPSRGDLVACYTPDGSAVCLGTLVGDPEADEGEVVSLERVLV
jgi:tRNA pseudouridine55 synthase